MSMNLNKELSLLFEGHADQLKEQWISEMKKLGFLEQVSDDEIEKQFTNLYDIAVSTFKTGKYDDAEKYARDIAQKAVLQHMTVDQIIGGMLKLRDVYQCFIFEKFKDDKRLCDLISACATVINKIVSIKALAFVEESEKEILQQQKEAMLALSIPVLQIRDEMLILPLIGIIDSARSQQIVEELLNKIAEYQASIIIIDLTGVPIIDSLVANHIIKTVQAAKMLGAETIITGISPPNAQTLVNIGVDISTLITKNNLRTGLKLADEMLQK
ncbi:MAG: STAS domain protein [Candidatus Argoarchaeum ethanivorans]|uniref:STAS domain protein n=1 Tax=Candidatus Argoarchaeum ethanivorans TaxID=2608793 RepID=A0A811TEK5_9EURY|nr:MAG: STAS domain protein [Candidatus Argoarchaeum ethanivorans]